MSFSFNNPLGGWCVEGAKHLPVSSERFQCTSEVSEEASSPRKRIKNPVKILVKHSSLESEEKSDSDSDLQSTASCSDIIGIMDENKDQAQPKKTVTFLHCSSSTSDLEDEVGRVCVGAAHFAFSHC